MYTVYILYSAKLNRFYVGSTSDLNERMQFHMSAASNKFTAKAKDWDIFLNFSCDHKNQALAIERHIKSMKSKVYIQNLKKYPEMVLKLKEKYA